MYLWALSFSPLTRLPHLPSQHWQPHTPSARRTQLLALFHLLSTDLSVSSFSQSDPLLAVSCFHGSYTRYTSLFSLLLHALFIMVFSSYFGCLVFCFTSWVILFWSMFASIYNTPTHHLTLLIMHTKHDYLYLESCHGEYMQMFILIDMFLFHHHIEVDPLKKKSCEKFALYIHTCIQMYAMYVCGNLVTRVRWTAPLHHLHRYRGCQCKWNVIPPFLTVISYSLLFSSA